MKLLSAIAATVLTMPLLAQVQDGATQPQQAADTDKLQLVHTELDAVGWALDALLKYQGREPYIRFVYLPPWADAEWIGVMNVAVNLAASHTTIPILADVHAGGWLLAYDLEQLAGGDRNILGRLVETWDELARRDAVFHVPELNLEKSKGRVALLAPHLQDALARHVTNPERSERLDVLVTGLTRSTGAIYPADFLLEQLLTSVRGKYPEFRQIDFQVKQFTPLQALLKKRGFFFEQSQDGKGDKGAYLIWSEITGKDRIIDTAFGLFSRQPVVISFDPKDLRTRAAEQFARNLLEFERFADASEIFIPMPNGLTEYVLADAKGNIQRVAPPDIVADHKKPAGYTHELEMGMSCIMCHFPDGGYKLKSNDLEKMLGSDIDIVGENGLTYTGKDGKAVQLTKVQAVAKLAGRYGEPIYDPDGILGRAERDFTAVIDALTDYDIAADEPNCVVRVGAKMREIYHGYRYTLIDAEKKCLSLGVKVPSGRGKETLRRLSPPLPKGQTDDIMIGFLKNGAKIKRDDDDAIHVELARRALVTRPTLFEEGNP